jgi:GNAT superfamily N-acetyltransferase
VSTDALQRLRNAGHTGIAAVGHGPVLALMTGIARGTYAHFPAEGFAVAPEIGDPTTVLARIYGELAPKFAKHRALHDSGALHLIADLDGSDVGLLTIELTSPAPRLCPEGQPYIGQTATQPDARGRGVGHALVNKAVNWAHDHGYQWISVDFDPANPLSRPFWLGTGFSPVGYCVLRTIHPDPQAVHPDSGGSFKCIVSPIPRSGFGAS